MAFVFFKPAKNIVSYFQRNFSRKWFSVSTSKPGKHQHQHYDLIVIGGGSGGLACAKEAGNLGRRTLVLDFVEPSYLGTTWGLGGTCVNVGCIPKKLMHHAALLGGSINEAKDYGWEVPTGIQHNWQTMCQNVQGHVKSLNWGHRVQLRDKGVEYLNAHGYVVDPKTVLATPKNQPQVTLTTDNIVIATGMRPNYPAEVEGAKELSFTSDDLFWTSEPPNRTLVVGASYVALECAGFISGLGFPCTVMIRSIPLRGFDRDMADLVVRAMHNHGTDFIFRSTIQSIKRLNSKESESPLLVTWINEDNKVVDQEFDTVLMATGRYPVTANIGLEEVGVVLEDGYVLGGFNEEHERSSISNIYAIGDVLKGAPELTPVAILAGKLLARRMFNLSKKQMDYKNVPTTVFTPLEYACVGMSEEQAKAAFTEEEIEVYHAFYKPLEFMVPHKDTEECYIKVVCARSGDQRVLGIHITGPSAGEILQGFAVAFRCGLTYSQLESTCSIHPTVAEEIVKLNITKRSGQDPHVTAC